jgi:Pectate lyase superfamily protein
MSIGDNRRGTVQRSSENFNEVFVKQLMKAPHCVFTLIVGVCVPYIHAQGLPSPNGAVGKSIPPAAITNLGLPVISVVNYGATGNGTTDDTGAIDLAMKACISKAVPYNGCILYFPSGVYITTGLVLRSFVNIRGDGWGTSVIQLKPNTASDVLTVPAATFNFSVYGLTFDGNSAKGGTGNCFSIAPTGTGPAEWNTANKHAASTNAQKWAHIEQVMFSNCSADGIHINAFNYMLFFDNFYVFNNGVYGLYTEGTNSGFTNFQIERNGKAGIHIAGSNNRFISGEVIWNGSTNNTEAAVYVAGGRNIITAVENEDNYTSGFFDTGSDDLFIGCVSDSDGYVQGNPNASSLAASGFILSGRGGIYIGDKVASYRGRLPDRNFATEWPYRIDNPNQARIDISYDSTNKPPAKIAEDVVAASNSTAGHVACIKSAGPPAIIGFCSSAVNSKGSCTCN